MRREKKIPSGVFIPQIHVSPLPSSHRSHPLYMLELSYVDNLNKLVYLVKKKAIAEGILNSSEMKSIFSSMYVVNVGLTTCAGLRSGG